MQIEDENLPINYNITVKERPDIPETIPGQSCVLRCFML